MTHKNGLEKPHVIKVVDNPTPEIWVSFASEDREFVGEIVSQLTASNARVFCDSDFSAGIRGEELPGHLDRVYRRKTPHAVIFVSRFYAEKMWARYGKHSRPCGRVFE